MLLLDLYNTKFADQVYAKSQVIRFLRQVRPEDHVAIYLLNGLGLSVIHDFTNESETLQASLVEVLPDFSPQLDASELKAANTGNDGLDSFLDTSKLTMSSFFQQNREVNTSLAFKMLAQHLAGVPGRKSVVWISGAFPIDFMYGGAETMVGTVAKQTSNTEDQGRFTGYSVGASALRDLPAKGNRTAFSDSIESAAWAMNTANVAVYPVDARGLMGTPMADASRDFKPDRHTLQLPQAATTLDQRNFATMDRIAELTRWRGVLQHQ